MAAIGEPVLDNDLGVAGCRQRQGLKPELPRAAAADYVTPLTVRSAGTEILKPYNPKSGRGTDPHLGTFDDGHHSQRGHCAEEAIHH